MGGPPEVIGVIGSETLESFWLVTVQVSRKRILKIDEIKVAGESYVVKFAYGWANSNLADVTTTLSKSDKGLRINLVTPAKSKIEAFQKDSNLFEGLFTTERMCP